MKRLTFLMAFFISISLNAQWTNDTDVNTLVVESTSGDMQAIGTSDGQTYVVFWKAVPAPQNYELRIQLLDADGYKKFGNDGKLVSNTIPMSTYILMWSIEVDNNDNIYIGVTGTQDFSGHVYKLDTEGNQLWGNDGISLSEALKVTILPLSSGDAVVSWLAGNHALMQKYDSNGNAVWSNPVTVVSGSSKTAPGNLFEMSDGGFTMIFHTYNYGISSKLYAQRYGTDGTELWSAPVKLSNNSTAYNKLYSGTQDGDTIFIGYSSSANNRFDSYLQRINPDGILPWGINGMDFDISQNYLEMNTRIAFSQGSQYVWSICRYSDVNQNEFGEYIQKFNKTSGERQFTDDAKTVYAVSSECKSHVSDLYTIGDQPFFLLEKGYNTDAVTDKLYVLLLDQNGNFVWPEEVKPMATYEAAKSRIQFTKPANNMSVAVFIENKSDGEKIYAQNFVNEVAPDQPILISPENGAENIPLDVEFIWANQENAETYSIKIAEDSAFQNVIADESNIPDTSYSYTLPENQTTYYWKVMATNSAGNSEWSETWHFTTGTETGVNNPGIENKAETYPNPAKDFINIDFNSKTSCNIKITVINATGTTVFDLTKHISSGKNSVKLDTKNLPTGTYFYIITGEGLRISNKFVKI